MASGKLTTISPPESTDPWIPTPFFFYGSLMLPKVLKNVIRLDREPVYTKASISGFDMKIWSIYPTLVKTDNENKIEGLMHMVETEEQARRLETYESSAYTWCFCNMTLEDGSVVKGRVFIFSHHPNAGKLTEGKFDIETYKKQMGY